MSCPEVQSPWRLSQRSPQWTWRRTRGNEATELFYEHAVSCPPPLASRLTHSTDCRRDRLRPNGQFLKLTHLRHLSSQLPLHVSSCWTRFSNIAVWGAGKIQRWNIWYCNGVCVWGYTKISSHPWRLKAETNSCLLGCPGTLSHRLVSSCAYPALQKEKPHKPHTAVSLPRSDTLVVRPCVSCAIRACLPEQQCANRPCTVYINSSVQTLTPCIA